MIPFIIGNEQKQELALLKQVAESNPFSAEAMMQRVEGMWEPGDEVRYTCYIPINFKVVFTIETGIKAGKNGSMEPAGVMYRHLSMSIGGKKNKTPHPLVCQEVMNELGFVNTLDSGKCQVWSEREGVINIIEFI